MYKPIYLLAFLLLGLSCSKSQVVNQSTVNQVDSKTFSELIKKGDGIILDVRTQGEYIQGHIPNSTLISTNDPGFVEKVSLLQKDKPIYVYCLTGSRSRAVANYLNKNGYSSVFNLTRGIVEWQYQGFALTKSSSPIEGKSRTYSIDEFNTLITANNLVLVDFHAVWCAPCKQMAPIVEQVQKEYIGRAVVEKVDIQSNKALQSLYKIESIPGLILFKDGLEVWKHTGTISYNELGKVIEQYL